MKPLPDFQTLARLVEETTATADDIVYHSLNCIVEEKTEAIHAHLPAIVAGILAQKEWRILKGVNKFLQEVSDLCSDAPNLPQWFWNLVLKPML